MLEFEERTIKVSIDTSKCPDCESKACVEACGLYSRGMLQLEDGIPSVAHLDPDEIKRRGTECLACEFECWQEGLDAIRIDVPVKGLVDYAAKRRGR